MLSPESAVRVGSEGRRVGRTVGLVCVRRLACALGPGTFSNLCLLAVDTGHGPSDPTCDPQALYHMTLRLSLHTRHTRRGAAGRASI